MIAAFKFRFRNLCTDNILGQVGYSTSQSYRHSHLICKPYVKLFISLKICMHHLLSHISDPIYLAGSG